MWRAWLQCKAHAQSLPHGCRATRVPRAASTRLVRAATPTFSLDYRKGLCLAESDKLRIILALVLNEPQYAAVASSQLQIEVDMCLKLQMIPSRCPRISELYRILALHATSRRALGIGFEASQEVTKDIVVGAPRLLAYLLCFSFEQTSHDSSALGLFLQLPSEHPSWKLKRCNSRVAALNPHFKLGI